MKNFLSNNGKWWKALRTMVQGLLSVLAIYLADILGLFHLNPTVTAIVAAAIMSILAPIMAAIGETETYNTEDINYDK